MNDNVFKLVNMIDVSYDVLIELDSIVFVYDKSG